MQLSFLFTDHMVIQQGKPVRVFGTGDGTATVSFCGNKTAVRSENGKWHAELPPCKPGGPYAMHVVMNGLERVIDDVMVGEVWIAGGQSNMEMPVYRAFGGLDEMKNNAEHENIRLFTVPRLYREGVSVRGWHFEAEDNVDTPWTVCTADSMWNFSAIGYWFAKKLAETGVAVGMISCNWGGTVVETWTAPSKFETSELLKPIMDNWEKSFENASDSDIQSDFERYVAEIGGFCDHFGRTGLQDVRELGLEAAAAYPLGDWPLMKYRTYDQNRPAGLFNTMVSRIAGFSAAGVLWYQGESNSAPTEAPYYAEKYGLMAQSWREAWGDCLPFYAVELAPYHESAWYEEPGYNWPIVREQQLLATHTIDRSYLACTVELGEAFDIHPKKKREVAERLARLAMQNEYGIDTAAYGPEYKSAEFLGTTVKISFTHGEGLFTAMRDIFAAGADGVFYPANSYVENDKLVVTCDKAGELHAVRCGFCCYDDARIYNASGLPAYPFRTDGAR